MVPRFFGNLIRGADLQFGTQEIRSTQGATIVSPEQLQQIGQGAVSIRRALGFESSEVAALRAVSARTEEIQRQNREYIATLNREMARHLTDSWRARDRGDHDEYNRQMRLYREQLQKVADRNRYYAEQNDPSRIIDVNFDAISKQARENYFGKSSEQSTMAQGTNRTRREIASQRELYVPPAEQPRRGGPFQTRRPDETNNPFR